MKMGLRQVGRLALRVEGDWWVAYYAAPDTMAGAIRLAKIHMKVVSREDRKAEFMELMRAAVGDLIESVVGERPADFEVRAAPEHERAGRA